jgi:predicted GNAT family N-acyltransferase
MERRPTGQKDKTMAAPNPTTPFSNYTFTTKIQPPPLLSSKNAIINLQYPTTSNPRPPGNPTVFTDAMIVRDRVFVQEQGCSAEAEIDDDDARSWHWVMYARAHPSTSTSTSPSQQNGADPDDINSKEEEEEEEEEEEAIPVGVIRLVPPPHAPHETLHHPECAGQLPKYDLHHEPYIKITRVAVLPRFRGYGLSKLLMNVVHEWAAEHPGEIDAAYTRAVVESEMSDKRVVVDAAAEEKNHWTGLSMLHAQVQVERMYQRLGYETDTSMGVWDEEGIEHVGMVKRLDISASR